MEFSKQKMELSWPLIKKTLFTKRFSFKPKSLEIIEKEVDAYKKSLQEKTMSGKKTSFTTSYLC